MSSHNPSPPLLKHPVFSDMSQNDIVQLTRRFMRHPLRPNEVLFREGAPGESLAVVESGALVIEVTSQSGRTIPITKLGPSDVVGEMTCLDPAPRSASVRATTQSSVLLFSHEAFQKLCLEGPHLASGFCRGILRQIYDRLVETNLRIERALRGSPHYKVPTGRPAPPVATQALADDEIDVKELANLHEMSPEQLDMLRRIAKAHRVGRGTVLARQGDSSKSCFILVRGEVAVSREIDGNPQHLATLGPGSMMGQLALIGGAPRSATLTAQTDAILLFLSSEDYWQLLTGHSPLVLAFQRQLAIAGIRQLRGATERAAALLSNDALAPNPAPLSTSREDTCPIELARVQASLSDWGISHAR